MAFYGFSEWRGLDGRTTRKTFRLQTTTTDPVESQFTEAQLGNSAIVTALGAITNATVQDVGVSYVVEAYNAGAGDLTEQALVNVWAEDPDNELDVLSISQVYIPAPVVGIFLGASGSNYNKVDPSDAALQTFIDALAAQAYISDMEIIDTGTAVNGIENGRRVTRKLPAKT